MIDRKCTLWAVLLYLGATMVGLGVVYTGSIFSNNASASPSSPYLLTLVETMNPYNKSLQQPAFYVLGPNGLQNSSTISLPAHRLIQLTIVSYDTPTPGSTNDQGKVTGTVGGNVFLMNGTIATIGNMTWGHSVTSVPAAALAHTFTLPDLGVNIPVVGGSTIVAYLSFNKAGTYTWICKTPCGFPAPADPSSTGAMAMNGWMTGQIVVQ